MNPRKTLPMTREKAALSQPSAMVIAMPQAAARRFRRDTAHDAEPLGQILLFTGVRYERMPDIQPEPAIRQRKRS